VNITGLEIRVLLDPLLGSELGTQQSHFIIRNHQPTTYGDIITRFTIDGHLDVSVFVVTLFGGRRQRQLYRFEDDVLGHTFLVRYRFCYQQNFFCHLKPRLLYTR
jgi:hypothetical protein